MKSIVVLGAILSLMPGSCVAEPGIKQFNTTSWHGLTGLYVTPTARLIGRGKLALGFNESKHSEFKAGLKFSDRQIRGVLTYGLADPLEFTATFFNDLFMVPNGYKPDLDNQAFKTVGLKLRLLREDPHYWYPEVSIGVRDIFNDTANVGPLKNINNGTRVFLLASKRMLKNEKTGAFFDIHAGLGGDHNGVSGTLGLELALVPTVSLIAEGIYDSPYLNFREFGTDDVRGRYLLNVGVRVYPDLVPGMVLDTGFVGDSEFEFSFGVSYVTGY